MVNLATFTIVAHRNLLSMYDMRKERNGWIDTERVGDMDFIRDISIEKRRHEARVGYSRGGLKKAESLPVRQILTESKAKGGKRKKQRPHIDMITKYEVGCLTGPNRVYYVQIVSKPAGGQDGRAGERFCFHKDGPPVIIKGRVVQFYDDNDYAHGMTLMVDRGLDKGLRTQNGPKSTSPLNQRAL